MSGPPSFIATPTFEGAIVEDQRKDGYWLKTFQFFKDDKFPGLINSGLISGAVEFLDNPLNKDPNGDVTKLWDKYVIAELSTPVALAPADINGNGLMDVVVCHQYGPFMLEADPTGGWISWLENPGRDKLGQPWKMRTIGRWPSMHRLFVGHFTQKSFIEVIGASIVTGAHDKTTPIPILCYQQPHRVEDAIEWPRSVVDDEHFTIIHEFIPKKLKGPNGLDSLLVASREGTTWLYFEDGKWKRESIGIGEPQAPGQTPDSESPGTGDHWGTGCVDAGKIGDDPFAYIATIDPYHGNAVNVYTKTERGLVSTKWKRNVLDMYGTPTQLLKYGDGPGHFVVCADFDGDGDDEFMISLMGELNRDDDNEVLPTQPGPNPNKGIMYYKAIDLEKGLFAKWLIAPESSARVVLGNFTGGNKIDIASVSYNVARYYEEPQPVVRIYKNTILSAGVISHEPYIESSIWNNEGIVYITHPEKVKESASRPIIEVANYVIVLDIVPPGASYVQVGPKNGVKVLYGSLTHGKHTRQPLGGKAFPHIETTGAEKDSTTLTAHKVKGAVILRIYPINPGGSTEWSQAGYVPVKTLLNPSSPHLKMPFMRFTKVEDLWWGADFKGVEFYNLSGFHFRFLEDKVNLAHIQFWAAGKGVNCGVHNHTDKSFKEIHVALSPGTKTGGMSRLKAKYEDLSLDEIKKLSEDAFEHVALPRLYEHGGLWHRDCLDNAVRGKKNVIAYPWHKWQAGQGDNVDVWMAVEFNPELAL